jgi:ubiquinone biosynthesis protein Coq4
MIDQKLLSAWLEAVSDPEGDSISKSHLLFYELADEAAKQNYYEVYHTDSALQQFVENPYIPADFEFEALSTSPEGSLGYVYYRHITDKGLNIIKMTDYPNYRMVLENSGGAKGMPQELVYTTFRSRQIHDLTHILAGYGIDHYGELAVQAFTLAQFKRPYPILLIAAATTHAAFHRPDRIETYLDAIADGWTKGKKAKNLLYIRWEEKFDQPLVKLQHEYNLV